MQPKEQEILSNIAVKLRHYAKNPENMGYLPDSLKRLSLPEFIGRRRNKKKREEAKIKLRVELSDGRADSLSGRRLITPTSLSHEDKKK